MERWAWIGGWGIAPQRFQAALEEHLPGYEHLVVAPTVDAVEKVIASGALRIGGYSLGSLLVLAALERFSEKAQVYCLAPILAFCKEEQAGGTTPLAALQTMQAKLQQAPAEALELFRSYVGLHDEPTGLPYELEGLAWGLETLAAVMVAPVRLERVEGFAGRQDVLIDVEALQARWPECQIADSCGHNYRDLLSVWTRGSKR